MSEATFVVKKADLVWFCDKLLSGKIEEGPFNHYPRRYTLWQRIKRVFGG